MATVSRVRAKMTVESLSGNAIKMRAINDPNAQPGSENASFTKATPNGTVEMTIDNPDALNYFKAGDEVYVDFTKVSGPGAPASQPGAAQRRA